MSAGAALRIGDLAEQFGVSVSAIRFYEDKGLLHADARVGGQRRYSSDAVERLRLIVTFRQAGLTVSDIAVALDRDPARAPERRRQAEQRAADLREQVRTTLSALVVVEHAARCRRDPDDSRCIAEVTEQRSLAICRAERLLDEVAPSAAHRP